MLRHHFAAVSFVENLPLRALAAAFPEAERSRHQLRLPVAGAGAAFLFPFGAAVFQDLTSEQRDATLTRLRDAFPKLNRAVGEEELVVVEDPAGPAGLAGSVLTLDQLGVRRAAVIAIVLAQSAALEYYEGILEGMFARTSAWIGKLERAGTAPLRTRPLHRFIGEAVAVRSEVLSVLHLLDTPDEVWEDAALDAIYRDLRAELDLADRFHAVELQLRSVQESLELVLDVVRDRRMVLLEAAIVLLIVMEIVLSLVLRH
jgi:uncharacterized Rmd1/YagE family protein